MHWECSAKGKEEGTGGHMYAKFAVAISHGAGVIECFWYEGNINEELFFAVCHGQVSPYFQQGE